MTEDKNSEENLSKNDDEKALNSESSPSVDQESVKSKRDPALDRLLNSATDDEDDEVFDSKSKGKSKKKSTGTSLDKKGKKSKSNVIVGALLALVLIGGGGTVAWMYLSPDKAQVDETKKDGKTQNISDKEASPENEVDSPWTKEDKFIPIKVNDWQKSAGSIGVDEVNASAIFDALYGSDLYNASFVLPSESAGFTSDDSLILNEDGSINPMYSFWTRESFTSEAGSIIEKFLNPVYGDWLNYQNGLDPNGIKVSEKFPLIYTDAALANESPVKEWLPIYADWDMNNYNRTDLPLTGPRWFGQITESTTTFTWNEEELQYSASMEADVKFTSYTSDGEKVTQNGKLTIDFVANPDQSKGSGGKVLVNKSKLSIQ